MRTVLGITGLGAVILTWELIAQVFSPEHLWSELFARRDPRALPIVLFAVWLPFHLLRYKASPRRRR